MVKDIGSFYWFDFETFGVSPSKDRPAQFAGIRTDTHFKPIEPPKVVYAKPSDDVLPTPEACLLTGITPQLCQQQGLLEVDFFREIFKALSQSGTCALGYNNLRFDDEFIRMGFYRNFLDPYEREWRFGNSRWDLLDVVRSYYALQVPGIEWPEDENGVVSFKLEHLSRANGLLHEKAHDALSDVYATIALAERLQQLQPELFARLLALRNKQQVASQLDFEKLTPFAHVSGMIPVSEGCLAAMLPLARHPTNPNAILCWNLAQDPSVLNDLSAEMIQQQLFTPAQEREGPTIAIKQVHLNRSPVVLPMAAIRPEIAERWQLKGATLRKHLKILREFYQNPRVKQALLDKLSSVFAAGNDRFPTFDDPDLMLYSGPFFSKADKQLINKVQRTAPSALATTHFGFEDTRLPEMLFRYRARNYPDTLDAKEHQRWQAYRSQKLLADTSPLGLTFAEYAQQLQVLGETQRSAEHQQIIQDLVSFGEAIYPY